MAPETGENFQLVRRADGPTGVGDSLLRGDEPLEPKADQFHRSLIGNHHH